MKESKFPLYLTIGLVLFLLLDTGYTFYQHVTKVIDGDLVPIVLPAERYQKVLEDPFGLTVLLEDKSYAAPNRFFVHWYLTNYFKITPGYLQKVMNPVDSLYYAAGLSKTLIHIFLIALLAFIISGRKRLGHQHWLLAAALLVPIFQTGGHFAKYIAVVASSITYSSFYALPMLLLILFLTPYEKLFSGQDLALKWWQNGGLLLLTLILPFSGPLIPGVVLVLAFLWGMRLLWEVGRTRRFDLLKKLNKPLTFYFIWLAALSLYSIYIGQSNAENINRAPLSILERYERLPMGLYYQLTQKLAYPLLLLMIIINTALSGKVKIKEKEMKRLLRWIGCFALVYLLLLPLGGSRSYRPYILRNDTMLPIILALIYYYGQSTFWLIQYSHFKYKKAYVSLIILVSLIFTYADEPDAEAYLCQREALIEISESKEKVVRLKSGCTVLSWKKITDPKGTEGHAQLFELWNLTTEKRLFYQD